MKKSLMWGIATGTTMGLHRLRMGSKPNFALNISFITFNLVAIPSYYFCYRKREHKEQMIELMMKANDFAPLEDMPPTVPLTDHPFISLQQEEEEEEGQKIQQERVHIKGEEELSTSTNTTMIKPKEYRGWLKELKEWQKPPKEENRELGHVFQEIPQEQTSTFSKKEK